MKLSGITISTGDMEDVLYFDRETDHSLWGFHPDGMDVVRVAKTFKAWISK